MVSSLSATAGSFQRLSESPSRNSLDLLISLVCRTNEDIGTYEHGVLKPRKGVSSLITWRENLPFLADAPSSAATHIATDAPVPSSIHDDLATIEPAATPVVTDTAGTIEVDIIDNESFEDRQTEEPAFNQFEQNEQLAFDNLQPNAHNNYFYYLPPPYQVQNFYPYGPIDQSLYYAAPAMSFTRPYQPLVTDYGPQAPVFNPQVPVFAPQVTLACDIAVSEANRPAWDPTYHKAISPSVERANRVVEEFKVYASHPSLRVQGIY
jgi:hypothetical protein